MAFVEGPERLAYTVNEVAALVGVGRSSIYEAINNCSLKARKFGRRTMILAWDLEAWLDGLPVADLSPEADPEEDAD
jgi:excisionase family DNA binding protein